MDRATEKLIKAFALGHPTMVVGNPRTLRFATELGFQDFSPVMGSGYDRENDPGRRFEMIFEQVAALRAAIRADPAGWLGAVREIGAANARLAIGGGAVRAYAALYDRPVVERLGRRMFIS